MIGDEGKFVYAERSETGECLRVLSFAGRRVTPVISESLIECVGELGNTPLFRNLTDRNNLKSAPSNSFDRALVTRSQLRCHPNIVVDPSALRLKAGILQQAMVIRRIVTQQDRRE